MEKGGGREEGRVEKERKKGGEGRGHMTHKGMVGTRNDMPILLLTVRWPSKLEWNPKGQVFSNQRVIKIRL